MPKVIAESADHNTKLTKSKVIAESADHNTKFAIRWLRVAWKSSDC
jgi:hypothetical protein